MSKREAISRYNLILKKIRKYPATWTEISEFLKSESELQGYNFGISKRTFQRDLNDIRSIYNIDIECHPSTNKYYIENNVAPDVNERILEAFDTFNALNISDRISNNIHFEKRRPQGTENLHGLLHAINNKVQISFSYHKFWEDGASVRKAEPYALKEFKNRWYVLAKDLKDNQVKSFALDRLKDLETTKIKFQLPDNFDVNEHYKYSFGIISPDDSKPEEVILSFEPFQGKYIKTLPLHETQKVLVDNEKELRIKLKLFVTLDFTMELLSYGSKVKVISPLTLVDEIKSALSESLANYQ